MHVCSSVTQLRLSCFLCLSHAKYCLFSLNACLFVCPTLPIKLLFMSVRLLHAKYCDITLLGFFYEIFASNNYIDNCHILLRNVNVDF
jgi:hypothetical protein